MDIFKDILINILKDILMDILKDILINILKDILEEIFCITRPCVVKPAICCTSHMNEYESTVLQIMYGFLFCIVPV